MIVILVVDETAVTKRCINDWSRKWLSIFPEKSYLFYLLNLMKKSLSPLTTNELMVSFVAFQSFEVQSYLAIADTTCNIPPIMDVDFSSRLRTHEHDFFNFMYW